MDLFLKLATAAFLIMLLFYLWPAYKAWQQRPQKAEQGDWPAAILAFAAVAGFVVILIMMVR